MCIGVYSVKNSAFDVYMVLMFGTIGYFMRMFHFPAAPMLLGFILGPMMEEHFRRALLLSRGDFWVFVERPISLTFLLLTVVFLAMSAKAVLGHMRRRSAV